MTDDFYDYDDQEVEAQGRGHLFLWTVFILLLVGLAFACWLGSFYVFGHPELPRPYEILLKLHKLDPPKRFEITAAPPGEYLNPQRLFERYSRFSPLQLENENAELLRNYLKNYRETKKLVPYATGHYEIVKAYELHPSDLFASGMVALAAADDHPQVLLEHVYPTAPENVARLRALLQPGLDLKVEKTFDVAAVIHVQRTTAGRFQFTVVPISYGNYALKQGVGTFSLEPPPRLNVAAGAPIIRGPILREAMEHFAEFRRSKPVPSETDDGSKPQEPELVRLDTLKPGEKVPETGALPDVPVATPIPLSTPRMVARASATPPRLVMNSTPRPRPATPMPIATPIPVATPLPADRVALSPSGVPLKPFIASLPERGVRPGGGNWRTYAPGQQPFGRTVTPTEAGALAERGDLGERIYLRGSFVVTAAGDNWAVLRPQGASTKGTARVIVEYPASAAPPPEGATFSRDESRPFQVQEVRRGEDGQVNITVREVTQPQ